MARSGETLGSPPKGNSEFRISRNIHYLYAKVKTGCLLHSYLKLGCMFQPKASLTPMAPEFHKDLVLSSGVLSNSKPSLQARSQRLHLHELVVGLKSGMVPLSHAGLVVGSESDLAVQMQSTFDASKFKRELASVKSCSCNNRGYIVSVCSAATTFCYHHTKNYYRRICWGSG
jgi:hypothetical protein